MLIELKKHSMEELTEALNLVFEEQAKTKEFGKIHFEFDKEVTLPLPNGRTTKGKKFDLKIFKASNGAYAYTPHKNGRFGVYTYNLPLSSLLSVSMIPKTVVDWKKESMRLRAKIHDNVWADLKEKLNDDGSYLRDSLYGQTETISITSKFSDSVLKEIKKAFDEGKPYSYKEYGEKRDKSVEISIGKDGLLRAWYSSEFAGCGNGSYYLLLNPTTAAFREDD